MDKPESDSPDTQQQQQQADAKSRKVINAVKKHWVEFWDVIPALDKLNTFFTLIIMAATVVYVIVASRQLAVMKETLIEMQRSGATATDQTWQAIGNVNWMARTADQSATNTLIQMKEQTANQGQSAKAAQSAVQAAAQQMRMDQRAWVGVQDAKIYMEVNKPLVVSITVANTGKTPAFNYRGQVFDDPIKEGREFVPNYRATEISPPSGVVLFPGAPSGRSLVHTEALLDKETIDAIQNGTIAMYVYGRLCYEDAFRRKHWDRFCLKYDGVGGRFDGCRTYNETDNDTNGNQEQCK